MVTLKDIAARCGVSVATVSKALNGAHDVGAKRAENIRAVARQMGYFPNGAARSLKTNRSHNIGLLFQDIPEGDFSHEYYASVIGAIRRGLGAAGYDLTFICRNVSYAPTEYLEHCRYRNVDGVVIIHVDFSDPAVQTLIHSDIPVVCVGKIVPGCSCVARDLAQSTEDLVKSAYNFGHRAITFLHGPACEETAIRLESFQKSCRELGIAPTLIEGRFHDIDGAQNITAELLAQMPMPSCIFYPDDLSLLGGFKAANQLGLYTPADVSLVGFNGVAMSKRMSPTVATSMPDTAGLGAQTTRLILQAIEDAAAPSEHILIPGIIFPGETLGACK